MKGILVQLGPLALALFAAVCMLLFAATNVHAQNVQTAECSAGCNFAADVPANAGPATHCILAGLGANAVKTPIIDSTSITPKPPGTFTTKTCWWPGIVVAPGTYSATAAFTDATGKAGPADRKSVV